MSGWGGGGGGGGGGSENRSKRVLVISVFHTDDLTDLVREAIQLLLGPPGVLGRMAIYFQGSGEHW